MNDIDQVRLRTSDQPILRREAAEGDGVTTQFKLEYSTILASPVPKVWKDSVAQTIVTDFTVDYANGIITMVALPAVNTELVFEASAVVYTDEEIQAFIDSANGNLDYAAARNLFAWAANAAKLARKESLSGGGGPGSVTLDTAVLAEQLRKSAQSYFDLYKALAVDDTTGPADGITEVPWTEHSYEAMYHQTIIRDS